ncbi:MAG: RidA family protein [Chloroflexi bacterium]|nr:RidA family protein [Chloroflexota bacterium]
MATETFREIYLCPAQNNIVAGVMIGDFAIAPALKPIDATSGAIVSGGLAEQVRATLVNLDLFLDAAGLGLHHVSRMRFFMRNPDDREAIDPVWEERYPSAVARPPFEFIPANLPDGTLVVAEVLCS